jgi:hypothetical protein
MSKRSSTNALTAAIGLRIKMKRNVIKIRYIFVAIPGLVQHYLTMLQRSILPQQDLMMQIPVVIAEKISLAQVSRHRV